MKYLRWVLAFGVILAPSLAGTASAQIISTSLPVVETGGGGSRMAFHLMAGYARWNFAALDQFEQQDIVPGVRVDFTTPDGVLFAGDLVFQASESISVGVGGWYNRASFSGDLVDRASADRLPLADSNGDLFSGYGNIFYKKIGVQFGVVSNKQTLSFPAIYETPDIESKSTDLSYFLVGRFGGERWSLGVGAGGYTYGETTTSGGGEPSEGDTVASGFANVSIKLVKDLSLDAGVWYLAETSAGGDDATRLTVGLGYTF